MTWALPLFRIAGITVRLHLFFVAFLLAMIARAASAGSDSSVGLKPTLLGLGALFLVILLHEFGHAFACRAVGGRADEILLWPLGGLASCTPPERPKAHLWTALGGPLVNVALIAVLTPLIGLRTGQWLGLAIPNPFDLGGMIQRADIGAGILGEPFGGWVELFLILLNYISWTLLLFNLLPMFPLDGGRILQAILWKRHGYARSMRLACRSGLVGAVLLGIAALAVDGTTLLAIALFGGVVCFATAKQVEYERDYLGFEPDPSELAAVEEEIEPTPRAKRDRPADARALTGKHAEAPSETDSEIDAILVKILKQGRDSLTAAELDALARATERKRDGGKSEGGRA
jgi:Zn-dependent protease